MCLSKQKDTHLDEQSHTNLYEQYYKNSHD